MNNLSPTNQSAASSLWAGKITRKQAAAHCGLSVRTIDELTRRGVLRHCKIGKSIRYDLAEVEATLRERFHVGARGRAGCPQPAASEPTGSGEGQILQENLRPAIHESHADAAAAPAGTDFHDEGQETLGGGWRTNRPTSSCPTSSCPTSSCPVTTHSIPNA
ncbi:MAG: hypothetical protein B7Z37_19275 [Verrucomicrobia bacterium 12-59-8]|nr:MAG: hypothetical protein B7Z37_19275 [Verrucomicrobia bacterium 12-59-8]